MSAFLTLTFYGVCSIIYDKGSFKNITSPRGIVMPPVLEDTKFYAQISSGGTWENRRMEMLSFLCVSFTSDFYLEWTCYWWIEGIRESVLFCSISREIPPAFGLQLILKNFWLKQKSVHMTKKERSESDTKKKRGGGKGGKEKEGREGREWWREEGQEGEGGGRGEKEMKEGEREKGRTRAAFGKSEKDKADNTGQPLSRTFLFD